MIETHTFSQEEWGIMFFSATVISAFLFVMTTTSGTTRITTTVLTWIVAFIAAGIALRVIDRIGS